MSHHLPASFQEVLEAAPPWPETESPSRSRLERILGQDRLSTEDFRLLLSPAAEALLEPLARRARELTVRHFGRTMQLFTPLYLANHCINGCRYCGYHAGGTVERHQLSHDELRREAAAIAATGLRHILVLTGEAPKQTPLEYIGGCVAALREWFSSIAVEIYPLTTDGYRYLAGQGADSLTLYQEAYDRDCYARMHPFGPKRDFDFRLEAPERGCQAGLRAVNIGALLGLHDARREFFLTGLHAQYLQEKYPGVEIAISPPRIRPVPGGFQPPVEVTDRMLVQFVTAFRLFMPRAGITLSSRERAEIRDGLAPLCVTRMSAGSNTAVGGRTRPGQTGQFEIDDARSVPEMCESLCRAGRQPVFKDWQRS
ncbi:MAG: 2-iminoacetate synthase ThiH [Lentisphaeria bacterium]